MLEQIFCCCSWRRTSLGVLATEAVSSGKSPLLQYFRPSKTFS
jgi:hypothetical protein